MVRTSAVENVLYQDIAFPARLMLKFKRVEPFVVSIIAIYRHMCTTFEYHRAVR